MTELAQNTNWLAIIVSAIIAFVLGYLWYSPKVFGKRWAEGTGVVLDDTSRPPLLAMATQIIATFLLSSIVFYLQANRSLLFLGLVVLCLIFLSASQTLFSQKSPIAVLIDQGYVLAMVLTLLMVQNLF
jgi:hypothetical protein